MIQNPTDILIGVDCGKENDPPAVLVLSRTAEGNDTEYPYYYEIQFVCEMALHIPYPEFYGYVAYLAQQKDLAGICSVAVDHTGVGQVVVDDMRAKPTLADIVWAVHYTSGKDHRNKFMNYTVPKRMLIHTAMTVAQKGRLGISDGVRNHHLLKKQLARFVFKRSVSNNLKFEAESEQDHDDIVNGMCAAIFIGQQIPQDLTRLNDSAFKPYSISDGNTEKGVGPVGPMPLHDGISGFKMDRPSGQGFWRPPR